MTMLEREPASKTNQATPRSSMAAANLLGSFDSALPEITRAAYYQYRRRDNRIQNDDNAP
jgi:hypothetical protein